MRASLTIINALLSLLLISPVFSQTDFPKRPAQVIFGELLGSGGIYSVNYDRRLVSNLKNDGPGVRLGASYMSTVFTAPLEFNYLVGKRHYLDMAIGVTLSTGTIDLADGPTDHFSTNFNLSLRYRFQALTQGLFFQIGGTYFTNNEILSDGLQAVPSLALGYRF